jgi:membrane-associated phospholipid phosphatase
MQANGNFGAQLSPMPFSRILFVLLLIVPQFAIAQPDSINEKPYRVSLKYELTGSVVFMTGSYFGFRQLDKLANFTEADLAKLDINKINAFDRPVASYDPNKFFKAQTRSDFFLNFSIASPVILALDKYVRRQWLELITLYLATHAVDNTIYFGLAYSIRRPRPFTYNKNIPVGERIGDAKSNSFFSGHVSFSATSTFFLVKVYTDIHQIKGWKRLALYTAAAIPPSLVGYYRVQGARHFRTDALLGLLIGSSSGILIPELHRHAKSNKHLSLQPYYSPTGAGGFTANYTF